LVKRPPPAIKTGERMARRFAAGIIIALPLLALADPRIGLGLDWPNHLWMIDYARAYFAHHLSFPAAYNIAGHVGVPQPIFYAPLLYPLLAILSLPLGTEITVRAVCVLLCISQFALVYRLFRSLKSSPLEALAIGAVVSWAIYPLSNLYSRAALPEFFATGLIQCAVAAGGIALLNKSRPFALLCAICAATAIGSHAPTALIGAPLLLVFALVAAPKRIGVISVLALGVALISAPWIFAVGSSLGRLSISTPNPYMRFAGKWTVNPDIDSPAARLQPLPLLSSSEVDAPWNFPLVLLAVWAALPALKDRPANRGLMALSVAAGAGLLAVSISTTLQDALPQSVAAAIQFPYRLVSHVNLAALVLLAAARGERPLTPLVLAIAVAMSAAGLTIKMHTVFQSPSGEYASHDALNQLPRNFVGEDDYTVETDRHPPPGEPIVKVSLPLGRGPLEEVSDAQYIAPSRQWIVTAVMSFPWNRLYIDGKPIPFDEVYSLDFHEAALVEAGPHTIGYRFEPPLAWVVSRWVSWILLAAFCLAIPLVGRFREARRANAPAKQVPNG
jgi:hypothetical protein